jgi:hypothetical protein
LYFSFGVAVVGSVRPMRKYYYLSKYLHTENEGLKHVYSFKGGLSHIELNAGKFFLEKEFSKTPKKLALLPFTFVVIEFGRMYYKQIKGK